MPQEVSRHNALSLKYPQEDLPNLQYSTMPGDRGEEQDKSDPVPRNDRPQHQQVRQPRGADKSECKFPTHAELQ